MAIALFPLGAWGKAHADTLVIDAIQGEEREHRIAVLRRGALTCQVMSLIFLAAGFTALVSR
ncbi:MAG: hypothetical protein L0H31_08775 [Nocardioidaceae bacterium]|nr:hypothetical protein [Nocardioidaceae bacterium]